MTDAETDQIVLQVLAGQSPGYLIRSNASAFVAEGLDEATVAASLARLASAGTAREDEIVQMRYAQDPLMVAELDANGEPVLDTNGDTVMVQAVDADENPRWIPRLDANGEPVLEPMLDANGNEVTIDAGWCITDDGKTAAASLASDPPPAA